ncbi:D-alanyl-lipoteichoic acid biosynthesis protein DltD [Lacticaseibacillus pantheris]|jgi:D-alanine transfer protein|uniref:Protein DltD n=1 Tax=Lacticaseibacillus pantheris DSM 15945 = JCM 12539 = NBRC 106106 TaxID=1423783 RepID=A0A0R1U2M8_9LACO|nr:D-alanyl-lipoteichoic acid biosynthesis protein DltD [Lacticaseibacillus pantheris]KRL87612.1 D-alanyl transfer protein DltD [Lacticaseibacillus pantheris DSM 15945 = JCM 12539 = NBRC 106106]
MSSRRKLWHILGPVIIAGALLAGGLVIPWHYGPLSQSTVNRAAVSMSPDVFLGERIKRQAVSEGYVPFMGSSELSRMDPLHPSVLATKYKRNYRPLLMGAPGTQSLTQFLSSQTLLAHKAPSKVVFIVSPQWFTPKGQQASAFDYYYSPLDTIVWLQHAHNTAANRYAAQRILSMPSGKNGGVIADALLRIAAGQKLTTNQRRLLAIRRQILTNEDALFSRFQLRNNLPRIDKAAKQLPAHDNVQELTQRANELGKAGTRGNELGIDSHFFRERLGHGQLGRLRGSQSGYDYRQSPEYSDLELVLNQFAEHNTQVLFVIPPVNGRWARYTGLSQSMMQQTVAKIKYQLSSQGFNHVLDLSRDGDEQYFMQDTIHLGWRGWLAVDGAVKPFLEQKQVEPQYNIQNRFLTKTWQQTLSPTGVGVNGRQ